MPSPAASSLVNEPDVRVTFSEAAFGPAALSSLARSAFETVPSAVTTTWSTEESTYHAMPLTPDFSTAWASADRSVAAARGDAAGADGATSRAAAARPATAASSLDGRESFDMGPPENGSAGNGVSPHCHRVSRRRPLMFVQPLPATDGALCPHGGLRDPGPGTRHLGRVRRAHREAQGHLRR